MTPANPQPKDLRAALRQAQATRAPDQQTVLDLLLQAFPGDEAWLQQALLRESGVRALLTPTEAHPVTPPGLVKPLTELQCVLVLVPGGNVPCLAMADPWDVVTARKACDMVGGAPDVVAVTQAALRTWMPSEAPTPGEAVQLPGSSNETGDTHQVVRFVDAAVHAAFESGASDIHFEISRSGLVVKLRRDGVMQVHSELKDSQRASEVISRIKVLAKLDITESRIPQDGRFRFQLAGGSLDLRVSIMPSVFGEDAVLRLLDKAQLRASESVSLNLLGFDAQGIERLRELSELPHGMILVTGPTGSGKTTTVYALLSEMNTGLEKIITIEDPVEYELEGVLQIPVNEKKGLTFAKGLRSILRHDPDRILVGEIRDAETAEIAVQSALTGHQVFTTVHANSIFDVTGRFRHFGLDMFGFMSALNGVVVQRLVRMACPHCVGTRPATARESKWLAGHGFDLDAVPAPAGCERCAHSGYKGRSVLAEAHIVNDAFRDLVTGNAPVSALREHVAKSGVEFLAFQAARMVAAGTTTPEEIKRVVGWQ